MQAQLACALHRAPCPSLLAQELLVHRQWSVKKHPEWLVFEAEQQLQIRPAQYWVALHLMNNRGHILQLNMGREGGVLVMAFSLHLLPIPLPCAGRQTTCLRFSALLLRRRLQARGRRVSSCPCSSCTGPTETAWWGPAAVCRTWGHGASCPPRLL